MKLSSRAMANVQHINLPLSVIDPVNDAIDMWPLAIEEMPEPLIFRRDGAAFGRLRQIQNRLFKTSIPLPGGGRIPSIDFLIQGFQIAFSTRRDPNQVGHV